MPFGAKKKLPGEVTTADVLKNTTDSLKGNDKGFLKAAAKAAFGKRKKFPQIKLT